MPNWCITDITIRHNDLLKLQQLYDLIEEWTNEDYKPNGFGHYWLGNIVLGSGVGTVDTGKDTDLNCRGDITYTDFGAGKITIRMETAWVPMLKLWVKVLDKYLPGAEFIYVADEPGSNITATNDSCLVGKYIIDPYGICNVEYNTEADEITVVELLQELLGTYETNVGILLGMLYDSDYDDAISIRKWEYCDISEWA